SFERGEVDWKAMTPPEWQAADERAIQELRDTGTCAAYEKEYMRPDGTRVPVLLVDAMLPGPETRVVAFALDLTERREASDALRDREQLLSQMGTIAKIGGWEFDPATGKGSWTPEVARIHDLDPDDETDVGIGLGFYEGDSRANFEKALEEAVELGREYDLELEMTTAKGIRKWVHTIGHPIVENGQVVRVTGSMQDITERKRAEATLLKQMEELRRWHDATLHRETRVLELKKEVNEMLAAAGLPPRYPSAGPGGTGPGSEPRNR
ncbi:MAG: PAS domain-containing protein, partial [Acidobacteria bacterium]|nr:PAS domain-containing protein [Acidobacteriota bacterium]